MSIRVLCSWVSATHVHWEARAIFNTSSRKDVFYSSQEVLASPAACEADKNHFLHLPQRLGNSLGCFKHCKLQAAALPCSWSAVSKGPETFCSTMLQINPLPPSPSEIFILELGKNALKEERILGKICNWLPARIWAAARWPVWNQTPTQGTALTESAGVAFKWLGRVGSPDDAD